MTSAETLYKSYTKNVENKAKNLKCRCDQQRVENFKLICDYNKNSILAVLVDSSNICRDCFLIKKRECFKKFVDYINKQREGIVGFDGFKKCYRDGVQLFVALNYDVLHKYLVDSRIQITKKCIIIATETCVLNIPIPKKKPSEKRQPRSIRHARIAAIHPQENEQYEVTNAPIPTPNASQPEVNEYIEPSNAIQPEFDAPIPTSNAIRQKVIELINNVRCDSIYPDDYDIYH